MLDDKVKSFLKLHNLLELEDKFLKLKELYVTNIKRVNNDAINAHILFQLIKINSYNSRSKKNPYKINKKQILTYFEISEEKFNQLNFDLSYFFSIDSYKNIKDYLTPLGEEFYKNKLKNGASKLRKDFETLLINANVMDDKHFYPMYCSYNMDTFFFEKLHLAFDITEDDVDFEEYEVSDEFLRLSYTIKGDHYGKLNILFTSLVYNPFNIDSILEVARLYFEPAKRDSIMDYLLYYCDKFYTYEHTIKFELIETKPYLRVIHQKVLWLLEDDKNEEAIIWLYKGLELSESDPMGLRFILSDIDPIFTYNDDTII